MGCFRLKTANLVSPAFPVLPCINRWKIAGDYGHIKFANFARDVADEATIMESTLDPGVVSPYLQFWDPAAVPVWQIVPFYKKFPQWFTILQSIQEIKQNVLLGISMYTNYEEKILSLSVW